MTDSPWGHRSAAVAQPLCLVSHHTHELSSDKDADKGKSKEKEVLGGFKPLNSRSTTRKAGTPPVLLSRLDIQDCNQWIAGLLPIYTDAPPYIEFIWYSALGKQDCPGVTEWSYQISSEDNCKDPWILRIYFKCILSLCLNDRYM